MACWIFQTTVRRWDLSVELNEGREDNWTASRYRDHMSPGDIAFLWQAGPAPIRGIYGWAVLTSSPYWHHQEQGFRVNVTYQKAPGPTHSGRAAISAAGYV
jgi:hypothetical protein